jgi:hypothetical protein
MPGEMTIRELDSSSAVADGFAEGGHECVGSKESRVRCPRNQPDRRGRGIGAHARLVVTVNMRFIECLYGEDMLPSAEEVYREGRRNAVPFGKGGRT